MKAPDLIHGKKFENYIKEAFDGLYKTYPISFSRVLDTAAAGGIVRKADGDFDLSVNSGVFGCPYRFIIEAKASVVHDTLAEGFRQLIKPTQNAKMILAIRAGIFGVFMFHAVQSDEVEIWSARKLVEAHPRKREKFYGRPAFVISRKNLGAFADSWVRSPRMVFDALVESEGEQK